MSMPFAFRPARSPLAALRRALASGTVFATLASPMPDSAWTPPAPAPRAATGAAITSVNAPAGRIVGVARDVHGNPALAAVFVDGPGGTIAARTSTDASGHFAFTRVDTGVRVVTVRVLGCRPWYGIRRVRAAVTESLTCVPECFEPECLAGDRPTPGCIERPADELARIGRRCRVHRHERLVADTVRIAYGLVMASPEFERARREFPNAGGSWSGGCVLTPASKSWAIVAACPACRVAHARWRDARGVRDEAARHDAGAAHDR